MRNFPIHERFPRSFTLNYNVITLYNENFKMTNLIYIKLVEKMREFNMDANDTSAYLLMRKKYPKNLYI
jgi:hypothetical protein